MLFQLDPERAHQLAYASAVALARLPGLASWLRRRQQVSDPIERMGICFPNRVGLAAGFDKHGYFPQAAAALGFGHIEVGAVTPLPQSGQPRPRLHRVFPLALRNHMGFNNDGMEKVLARLRPPFPLVVGLNLGKGVHTPLEEALEDYVQVLQAGAPRVSYFSVNISSPNTSGLRQLAERDRLEKFCEGLMEAARRAEVVRPLLLKVSPDHSPEELAALAQVARNQGFSGLIATNTSVRREGAFRHEPAPGGLSGLPLLQRSRQVVSILRQAVGPEMTLIGVGGIYDENSARAMIETGADLIQVYTGLVYEGPGLPRRLARELAGRP